MHVWIAVPTVTITGLLVITVCSLETSL
jgi:hypothetical protein